MEILQHPAVGYAAVTVLGLLILFIFRHRLKQGAGMIASLFRKPITTTTQTTLQPVVGDQDMADLAALKVVHARYERMKCTEGQAAVTVLFAHFFHDIGQHA